MSGNPVIGFVGVGLMGHGMAKNAVEKGFPLVVLGHRKREAVEDLKGRGATEVASAEELARAADMIVLCVTGAPQVTEITGRIRNAEGRRCRAIIDCSTSEPSLSARLAEELAAEGIEFLDAPLSRTPTHAWEGTLTTYIGGPKEVSDKYRPLLETWAEVVLQTDAPVGSAHAMKLIVNSIAMGYAAIWSEAYAMLKKQDVQPELLHSILSNTGLNCGNYQSWVKYVLEGDATAHKFALSNCLKDITYFNRMATQANASTLVSDGVLQLLKLGISMGMGERMMPEMGDIVLALNGDLKPS